MAGKHRAEVEQRNSAAYVWLGPGAAALALGAALSGGVGVAHADTTGNGSRNSGPTTTIRTTVSAQSVKTGTYSSSAAPKPAADGARTTSVVNTRESVVREQNPAITGDNNPGPGPTLAETVIGLNNGDLGVISRIPGANSIPFIDLGGGGGGGLLSKIAGALSHGLL